MKVKCSIFQASNFTIPTFTDIDAAQPKGAKVIYGGGKRKTKTIPYIDKLHLVERSFYTFAKNIVPNNPSIGNTQTELFLFQDKANELMLKLRYANEIIAVFEIDEKIIEEIYHYSWAFEWIERQIKSMESDVGTFDFFIEKNVGDKELYKSFPSHVKSTEKMIKKFDKSKQKIIKQAKARFTSGW
jgi:hypothetical protein